MHETGFIGKWFLDSLQYYSKVKEKTTLKQVDEDILYSNPTPTEQKWCNVQCNTNKPNNQVQSLPLESLRSIFFLLFFGLFLSTVVEFGEIFCKLARCFEKY